MSKTPSLKEVKEYFKNAKKVRCIYDNRLEFEVGKIKENKNIPNTFITGKSRVDDLYAGLWDEEYGYAKIITTKDGSEVSGLNNIISSLGDLLEYKNKNYGNSALNGLDVFTGKTKVGSRLDDKLARVKACEELRKNDVADIIGYLVLVCKENDWTNFDEFKD